MFTKTLRNYLLLILIILLAAFLRLWLLGQVPISMSDDEIRGVYTSYSIAHSGKDVYGNFMPVVFKMDSANTFAQVPIYFSSLFFLFSDLNSFTARLPYALSGVLSVLFFYLALRKIFDNKLALFSSFVLAVSAWHIQLSRFAIETDIALFMYIIGIYFFLFAKNRTKLIILSMTFFILAFYSYVATKVVFLPLLIILTWYRFTYLNKKHLLIILATILIAFGSFSYLSITQDATRYTSNGFFFFQDKEKIAFSVELERRASSEPGIIETLYHNKLTYLTRVFATNYLTAFSPQYLFLNQEASGIYSIWGRGEMYIFELPLFIIGFLYLFLKKRKEFYLVLLLLLISPLPSALGVNTPTWTSRSSFMIFWLCTFVGAGIYYLIMSFKNKNYRYLLIVLITLAYLYSIFGYLFQYYYDWSKANAKYFSKSTKDLVYKIGDYKKDGKIVLVAGATQNTFLHYAFYNKLDPKLVQENISKYPVKFSNFTFQKECLETIPNGVVYIASVSCKYKTPPSSTIKTHDNVETIWNIYEK